MLQAVEEAGAGALGYPDLAEAAAQTGIGLTLLPVLYERAGFGLTALREDQRRFLEDDGWVAWSGPAIAELLRQFVSHNRMMSGGFVINGDLVTLAEITCPVLAFVGTADDIGQPAAVRGILRAAPKADVYESRLAAGHFGLVVGSTSAAHTWPTIDYFLRGVDALSDQTATHV